MPARVLSVVMLVIAVTEAHAQSNAQAVERAAQLARDSCTVSSVQGVRTTEPAPASSSCPAREKK